MSFRVRSDMGIIQANLDMLDALLLVAVVLAAVAAVVAAVHNSIELTLLSAAIAFTAFALMFLT